MTSGRNSSGKFTKGHPGFKPKGAVSRKKQKQDQLLNQVFGYFEDNIEETLKALKPNQLMKFLINLNQLVTPKLKRIPYVPKPPIETEEESETEDVEETDQTETLKEKGEKTTFEFIDPTDPDPKSLNPPYSHSLFTIHCSLFTVHCSLFTVHYSQLTSANHFIKYYLVK